MEPVSGEEENRTATPNETTTPPHHCYLGGADQYTLIYTAFNGIVCLIGTLGNILVILSVLKFKTLRTITNTFVVSLAIADLLVCLCIPYYVSFYFNVAYGCQKFPCLIRYSTALYATIVSVLSLVGVAVDRYLAIVYALTYNQLMSGRLAWISVLGIHAYVAAVVVPIFYMNTWTPHIPECDLVYIASCAYALYICVLHVFGTMVITLGLYGRIFYIACHQITRVANMQAEKNRARVMETRTAVTMVLVVGVHVVCLTPFLLVVMTRYFSGSEHQDSLSKAKKFVMCLYFGKSCINPLIYGWKNKEYRGAFLKLVAARFQALRD